MLGESKVSRFVIFILLFMVISGCKPEEVGFSPAENIERSSGAPDSASPPADQDGDEPVPLNGPEIRIVEKPRDHDVSQETFVIFQIKQGDSEIKSIACEVNDTPVACEKDNQMVTLKGFPVGEHRFSVTVRDYNSLWAQDRADWTISAIPEPPVPPRVEILQAPQDHFLGELTDVSFQVIKGSEEIDQVTCQADGEPIICEATGDRITLVGFELGDHAFVVRAVDKKGFSDSAVAQWTVSPVPVPDPPIVEIISAPEDHFLGEATQVSYRVLKGTHPIDEILCQVDGNPMTCDQQGGTLTLNNFDLGEHQFVVQVTDSTGLKDTDSAEWKISQRFIEKITDVDVKFVEQKADILFVIDNSSSMKEEQLEVAEKIDRLFDKIQKLNWRLGIITTDPYEFEPANAKEDPFADGVLLPFPNGGYYLNSNMNMAQVEDYFAKTIFRPEVGNGHERGIRNTFRSIERYLEPNKSVKNQRLRDFYRQEASLSVVLISDENETRVDGVGTPLNDLFRSEPKGLYDLVRDVWGQDKKFQWNSVVIRNQDETCLNKSPHHKYGVIYEQMSRMTDGVIDDICADDYSAALDKIGSGVLDLQKVYKLDCVPQDIDGDSQVDLQVRSLDGKAVPGYAINGDQLEFDKSLEEGRYQFIYHCL